MLAILIVGPLNAQDVPQSDPSAATGGDDPFRELPLDAPLITRGDVVLTVGEVRAELATYPEERATQMRVDPEALRTLLNGMFRKKAMSRRARAENLQDDELARYGIQVAEDEFLAQYYLEREIANAPEPDFSILARERFIANKENYRVPERVKAGHILIKTEQHSVDEARAIATEVKEKLDAGEDFAELESRYSEDLVSGEGGSLGWFTRGRMVPEFEAAAFDLTQPGQISDIVQTQFGFHIIRLEDRSESYLPEYEEVEGRIIVDLKKAHLDNTRREVIASFDSRENVRFNDEALRALRIVPEFQESSQ